MSSSFTDVAASFLAWADTCLHKKTASIYRMYLDAFARSHPELRFDEVHPVMVGTWSRRWHAVQALKRLTRWAHVDARLVAGDALSRMKLPAKGMRHRIFSAGESARLLRACRPDLRRLLIALRETYARPGELRAATWADVRSCDMALTVLQALPAGCAAVILHEYKSKDRRADSSRPRVILISPRLGRLLARSARRGVDPESPLFPTARRQAFTPNSLRCRFRRLRKRLAIRRDRRGESIVPYTFRHTGATAAASSGVRDRILADVLGHAQVSTTWRYQHLSTEHLRDAMQKIWVRKRRRGGA